ncbi:hypothetical protein C8Q80DRAFT_607196 [Daedaleopsis nitida]|nr:hypothetical protein C8Q80DRAFT_607196 [Daedaleopsis nitida]
MSAEIPEAEIPPLQTVDVLALQRSVTIRPPKRSAPGISERGQARLIRQKLLEDEQEWEDRLALGITPAELKILQASVASVKAEFADLDGLSWDTPSAQQLLLHWHAQQAARERSPHASPGGGHPRGVQIRRSLSSLISSTSSSPSAEFTTREFEIQLDEVGQFDDDTNRLRPTTPLPPDDPDDDDDVQRTPLPSLFVRNVVNECTPKPYTHGGDEQQCGRDQPLDDVGSAIATPVLARPGMPKSHSAPSVHSLPGACFTADATPCAPAR